MQVVVLTIQILFVLLVPLLLLQLLLQDAFRDVAADHHNEDCHSDFYYEGYPRQPLGVLRILHLVEVVNTVEQGASDEAHAAGHEHVGEVAEGVVPESDACNSHNVRGYSEWSKR